MSMKSLAALLATLALAILATACDSATNTNTNTNTANANNANANANANANMNANANANANANRALTREEVDKEKDKYVKQAKDMGRKIGAGANDTWIWVKTRSALATADELSDSTINVDVENGVITLSGTVASDAQVKKADAVAKGIEGQTGVKNMLKVSAAGGNANGNKNSTGNANTKKG